MHPIYEFPENFCDSLTTPTATFLKIVWAFVPMVYTVRKSVGEFLWAVHGNFSSIFTRFRDTAAFVLKHATPTPPLASPKFSHVPLGVGGSLFGYKERRCWANCPCN